MIDDALRQLAALVAAGLIAAAAVAALAPLWLIGAVMYAGVHAAHWYDRKGL